MLWQLLVTKTNDYTSGKSLNMNIKWKVHKRTQQGVSAKLESYIYKVHMVCATNNYICPYIHATTSCPPHSLLKATMLYTCALMSSSRSFHHVLGLWCHIMWPVMWPPCHVPSSSSFQENKIKKKKSKIRKIKEKKIKIVSIQISMIYSV